MSDIGSVLADANVGAEDNSAVDSSTTEGNQEETNVETEVENVTPDSNEEEQPQEKGAVDTKSPPFHEHPRWKEVNAKLKALETENAQLKSKPLNNIEKPGEKAAPNTEEDDRQFEEFKRDLPVHKFKSGEGEDTYQTYDQLYDDIRKAMFKDLAAVQQLSQRRSMEREEQQVASLREGFQKTLDEIGIDIGSQAEFDRFKQFATEIFSQEEFAKKPPRLEMVYAAYLKDFYKKEIKPNASKLAASKVSKTSKPSLGADKKPGYGFIAGNSMEDIADAMMDN